MKKAVQRLLPSRSEVHNPTSSFKKSLKLDSINLIEDFYIELDDPHKTWGPGETITGTVSIDLKKNIANVNMTLTLLGFIKIKQSNATTTVRNKPTVLFSHVALIYGHDPNELPGEDSNLGLSKGEHRFPFSMKLPKKNIYTSISFEKGSITYLLRASINHNQPSPISSLNSSPASIYSNSSSSISSTILPYSKHSIHHCEKNIPIIVPINVARIPKPHTKMAYLKISDKKLRKTLSSTSTVNSNHTNNSDHSSSSNENSSPIRLAVDIPQSGYLRGELIPIKIKVSHYKPIQLANGIVVTLIRLCRVDNGPETPIQSFRKDLSQSITPLYIDPETLSYEVNTSLRVPVDAFPTILGSDIVSFQYYIEVLANVSNKNIIPSNISQTNDKTSGTKFSNSIVFDLDLTRERDLNKNIEHSTFINVDKFKRAKNLLGLNTEIIVGTERAIKSKENIGKRTILQNSRQQNAENVTVENDPLILDMLSQSSISPLSITSINNNNGNNNEIIDQNTTDGNISEKEALRLKEESLLLPSDPFPVPSYSSNNISSETTPLPSSISNFDPIITSSPSAPPAPSSPINYSSINSSNNFIATTEDKQELERRRLQSLESEPPEFDYVPEYIADPNQSNSFGANNAIRESHSASPSSSIPVINSND